MNEMTAQCTDSTKLNRKWFQFQKKMELEINEKRERKKRGFNLKRKDAK